jgi:ATP-binding cassette subfamily F protein 3
LGLTDAAVGYGDDIVLDGVDLHLGAGDRIGLLGVNGAGKSTLVKALSTGSTVLKGERVVSKDTQIGYFAQHQLELLRMDESPIEHLRDYAPDDREQDHRNYLGRFGFSGERIFEPVAPFSGGEKARLVLALMIRQAPNLLLLDEPTNHLDLEMRQALSVALIEYTGALVVISHDRHLLRSVCDELLIVHDGIVDRFNRSLDDYPAWLREQEEIAEQGAEKWQNVPAKKMNKKQQRQQQAQQRQRTKPLRDAVARVEKALAGERERLAELEEQLADESLYTEHGRKDELARLVREQADARSTIEALEWEWLEASEKLEQAEQE